MEDFALTCRGVLSHLWGVSVRIEVKARHPVGVRTRRGEVSGLQTQMTAQGSSGAQIRVGPAKRKSPAGVMEGSPLRWVCGI